MALLRPHAIPIYVRDAPLNGHRRKRAKSALLTLTGHSRLDISRSEFHVDPADPAEIYKLDSL